MSKKLDQDFLRELALTLDRLADKLLKGIEALKAEREYQERFYTAALKAHERLLNVTSRKLMEKNIHQLLAEETERLKLTRKHRKQHNWGGVPRRVINHE